jgi:hypothetical protein
MGCDTISGKTLGHFLDGALVCVELELLRSL